MNLLGALRDRLRPALAPLAADADELLGLVRPSQDAKFGDYQANFAMPLGKRLGQPPRAIAEQVVKAAKLDDLCQSLGPEAIAGPGFINLRLRDDFLAGQLQAALGDERLGVAAAEQPKTYVVDFSAPNVAKPMHVGHIRSTVIGASLVRLLRFLGHRVVGDNHIGDWGTQFGMIIFGWKNLRDEAAYAKGPVDELSRLYRIVNRLVDYETSQAALPKLEAAAAQAATHAQTLAAKPAAPKSPEAKELARAQTQAAKGRDDVADLKTKLAAAEADAVVGPLIREQRFPRIEQAVLAETAKLHSGDAENLRLWKQFLPPCLEEIDKVYRRLGVSFDVSLGESFYHERLGPLVDTFLAKGIARESQGAICVFVEGETAPMIIRKQDGAFLYATTDLATIEYRLETWQPDAIVYVVDHRQSDHFKLLFAAARKRGHDNVALEHVSFGTVLGNDGRPFKTRSGDTVGLMGLLDEAVSRAAAVVREGAESVAPEEAQRIAETVGLGALKYADLSQNRTSDYVFSYDKMLAMNGNTATYMQYAYARVRSIFAKGDVDAAALRASSPTILLAEPAERALGLELLRFSEALEAAAADYRPNHLTNYLFELANRYSTFFEQCPVLKAADEATRTSRLALCDLTARTIRQGLELLGIGVVEQM
jgi:arginyl-tRNA synthetase